MRHLHPYISAPSFCLGANDQQVREKEIPADSIEFAAHQGGVLLFKLPPALAFLLYTLNSAF
jgi:hypothetical protein